MGANMTSSAELNANTGLTDPYANLVHPIEYQTFIFLFNSSSYSLHEADKYHSFAGNVPTRIAQPSYPRQVDALSLVPNSLYSKVSGV